MRSKAPVTYSDVTVRFEVEFQALIRGQVSASRWDFGDGRVVSNAGNAYAPGLTDPDGNRRICRRQSGYRPYEFQGTGLSSFTAWLWHYDLPIDGSADFIDSDGDQLNNQQEWQADTDPTNSLSVLRLKSIDAGPPVTMQFLSSSNRLYTLLTATNLSAAPWTNVPGQADVPGTGGWQTLSDTNAAPPALFPCARAPAVKAGGSGGRIAAPIQISLRISRTEDRKDNEVSSLPLFPSVNPSAKIHLAVL